MRSAFSLGVCSFSVAAVMWLAPPRPAHAGPAWREVRPKDSGFAVKAPAALKRDTRTFPTPIGPLKFVLHHTAAGNVAYVVMYTDYPPGPLKQYSSAHMLSNASLAAVERLQGRMRSERDFAVQGWPAREVIIDAPDGGVAMRCRFVLAGKRLFQVMVGGPATASTSSGALRFVRSFRLMRSAPARTIPAGHGPRKVK